MGGSGSRLYPLTRVTNKHLLPVFDKPVIYYPLTTLMLGGLRYFIIISGPEAVPQFKALLGNGSQWGLTFSCLTQSKPRGIAECFRIAAKQLGGHNVALILGDNIFYSDALGTKIEAALTGNVGATVFACEVANPSSFAVVELGSSGEPISLEEKPERPRSNLAVPGLYFYSEDVIEIARNLEPSSRGELEITDVNKTYLEAVKLYIRQLGRGAAWLDGGTHQSLYDAGQFIKVVEERTGLKIACPEEIAFRMGYISAERLIRLAGESPTEYQKYLVALANAAEVSRSGKDEGEAEAKRGIST